MNKIILVGLLMQLSILSFAQIVETASTDSTGNKKEASSFLSQAGFGVSPDPLLPPRINIKTYKLSANIAGGWWDLYVLNTVPTFTINAEDSLEAFAFELLNQTGGIFNVSLSKVGYFANGDDKSNQDIKGAQIDFRGGVKLIDPPTRRYSEFIVPTAQASLDLRYLIPLTSAEVKNKTELRNKMMGNLSFRVYGMWQKIFAEDTYNEYFKTRKGNAPPDMMASFGYEINLFITNELFVSFGQTFSNIHNMPNRTIISLSYADLSK